MPRYASNKQKYAPYSMSPSMVRGVYNTAQRLLNAYDQYNSTSTRTRQATGSKRLHSAVGPARKHQKKYKKKRRLTIAEKALANLPYKFIVNQVSDRYSCQVGQQSYRQFQVNVDNNLLHNLITNAEGKVLDSRRNYKMYLKNVSYELMVKNQTNTQIVFYVYDMMPKYKDTTNIINDLSKGAESMRTGDSGTRIVTENNISTNPMSFPEVYKNYRVLKTYKYVLQAGEMRIIKFFRQINRYFNSTHLSPLSSDYQVFPGISSILLTRLHGTPTHASDQEGTVSTSSARVDMTGYQKLSYKFIENSQVTSEQINQLPTTLPGGQDIMEEATDTADIVKIA